MKNPIFLFIVKCTRSSKKDKYFKNLSLTFLLSSIFFIAAITNVKANIGLTNLQVEYSTLPIGIDVTAPRFSWQMANSSGERNLLQTHYQIEVKDSKSTVVWNSNKLSGNKSVGIEYKGLPLKSATRYFWTVTIWYQNGNKSVSESAYFETGLMNPDPSLAAWGGATWIGGNNEDLVLHAHYLSLFKVNYTVAIGKGSSKASFILGANDSRLMDKNKNSFLLANAKNKSYFKVELDIAAVDGTENGRAKINIYRAGYTDKDTPDSPVKTFEVKSIYINNGNKNNQHRFELKAIYGDISIRLDDSSSFFVDNSAKESGVISRASASKDEASINLNPSGSGHDYISFGMLCDLGFAVDAGEKASFSKVEVSNIRDPSNRLFLEDLSKTNYDGIYKNYLADTSIGFTVKNGAYQIEGNSKGAFVVADPSHNAMPVLRTTFSTENKKIETARLYVTARGIYEIYLNGNRVGTDYYNPGLTQYNVTHLYQTYDVTNMISNGKNALGAMLGEGWWSGLLSFGHIWNHFGDRQSLLAKLVITYSDGTQKLITTNNKDWTYYNKGPIVYSSLDMGEVYDATREEAIKDWSTTNYNDSSWHKAEKIALEGTVYKSGDVDYGGKKQNINYAALQFVGQIGENAGIYEKLTAISVKEVRKGVFVYNMGQNIVGVPKITIANGKAGQLITARVAEVLYPDLKESGTSVGMIMTENYRAALSQDKYTMKEGAQVFQPHFTSHGYQYIELTGMDEALPLEAVEALSISSIRKLTADYETSNPKVNKLWSNLVWSNVDNFLTLPTDCPQRNERMGWSGDLNIFSRTATYLSNTSQFMRRHMVAMRNVQTAAGKFTDIAPVGGGFGGLLWGSAGITVPWEAYQQYNDVGLLKEHYNAMVSYINYLDSCIDKRTGLCTDAQLGDWLGLQNKQLGTDFLVTVYHIFDLDIMAKVATILNKKADATKFLNLYKARKAFFNKTFVSADKKTLARIGGGFPIYADKPNQQPVYKLADTQTSYAVGLALGAFDEINIPFMVKRLQETVERENKDDEGIARPPYSLMTGFIGTAWISKALSENGNSNLAYKMLQNNKFPSWLYAVDQGATTIWERLNGFTLDKGFGGNNSMNSFNHYTFGAVGQWMLANSLGIKRDEPGFKQFILQPEPDNTGEMTWAKGYYDSQYGRINSGWKLDKNLLTYNATVPANTTATLYLPATELKNIKEGGKSIVNRNGISMIGFKNGKAIFKLQSGTYEFTAQ